MQEVNNSNVAWKQDSTSEIYAVNNDYTRTEAGSLAKAEFKEEHGAGFTEAEIIGENQGTGVYKILVYRY